MAARKTAAKTTATSKAKGETIAGIPITREELEPLFGDEMPLFASSYWCTFDSSLDLAGIRDAVAAHLTDLRAAKEVRLKEATEHDPANVYVEFAGKQVGVQIWPDPDEPPRWVFTAMYRGDGKAWGSNHALYLWLTRVILPWVGAKDVRPGVNPHARTRL